MNRLWAIVGATGTGKTALSLSVAKQLAESGRSAEIVNADAMQLYRGMDIGTAKILPHEREAIPHHLFDVLDPSEEAAVASYQPQARTIIREIHGRGNDAIIVGGSGLYVSSVLFDFTFPPRDDSVRRQIEALWKAEGIEPLLDELRTVDEAAAAGVDARNPRRVIRALEIARLGGAAKTELPKTPELWFSETRILGTHIERSELVQRLDGRVAHMWQAGLVEEVRGLRERGVTFGKTASHAIGYAQALAQLDGSMTETAAIEETRLLTRRYARRQVSWFRRYPRVKWISLAEREAGFDIANVED